MYACPVCDDPLVDARTHGANGMEITLSCPTCAGHVKYNEADDPLAPSFRPYTEAEIRDLAEALGKLLSQKAVAPFRCPIDRAPLAAVKHGSTWKLHCIRCGNDAACAVPD